MGKFAGLLNLQRLLDAILLRKCLGLSSCGGDGVRRVVLAQVVLFFIFFSVIALQWQYDMIVYMDLYGVTQMCTLNFE